MPIIFIILTFFSTFLGGLVGLKYRHKMGLLLGLTAGIILGVISFDLLPEIMIMVGKSGTNPMTPMIAMVVAFLIFHIAEKTILIHHSHEDEYESHTHPHVGSLQAGALIGHSFLDGIAIGLGFQVSGAVGILVAVAVIAHDFSDGLNTVALMLRHKNTEKKTIYFLILDSIAPVLGGLSTLFFTLSEKSLLVYLGFFTGFLLYIGVSDILPEAHSKKSSLGTIVATIVGVVFIYVVVKML